MWNRSYFWPCLLMLSLVYLVANCSDPTEESKERSTRRLRSVVQNSEQRAMDPVARDVRSEEVPMEPDSNSNLVEETPLLGQLDSSLAANDEEAVLDFMLDLEDQGGAQAVKGLGMVIDLAIDDELKLDAIASLSMLIDDEDISPPLLRAIDDPSENVRIEALDVIAETEMTQLLPILRLRAMRESDPDTLEVLEDTILELEDIKQFRDK